MTHNYFSEMLPVLAQRAKYAAMSHLKFANEPLSKHLNDMFDQPLGRPGAFLADPTFEAVFGWKQSERRMNDLAGGLLTKELVRAMDSPPPDLIRDYRFPSDQRPYAHQLKAWELLSDPDPQSIIVASGTGSGKTECFMVPILDRLVRERRALNGQLIGVRALFLYPLNALINSQRERLRAWTSAFEGDVRFCLYNGNTPESERGGFRSKDCETKDRRSLRTAPPPILVTNATMLEYMLIRTADAPILEASQGKLEWVVLDEAHTYIGSQAAEIALLIRRVLLAFGVRPETVRFVATSATIGDAEGTGGEQLRDFLAGISGVDPDRVHLVTGQRDIPDLPPQVSMDDRGIAELADIEPGNEESQLRYEALCSNRTARTLRTLFLGKAGGAPVTRLSDIGRHIGETNGNNEPSDGRPTDGLKWLDLMSGTKGAPGPNAGTSEPFLPLRAHLFHRTFSGLWACVDPTCSKRSGTRLDDARWPFGTVYFDIRKRCDCGSPVFEVVRCEGCGDPFLMAGINSQGRIEHFLPPRALDEFELEGQGEDAVEEDEAEEPSDADGSLQFRYLIGNRELELLELVHLDRETQRLTEPGEKALAIRAIEDAGATFACPSCGTKEGSKRALFLSSRIGAPYFLGSVLPTLLEYAPDAEKPATLPCRGRRLLSFNDSRQGTARIAARLQQEAERNRIRGLLYHLTLSPKVPDHSANLEEIVNEIEILEKAYSTTGAEQLRELIEGKRGQLAKLQAPDAISFLDLASSLANCGSDFDHMLSHYRRIAGGVFQNNESVKLATMFLIREFGRRPKRSNNLESMGMVAIKYPALEKIRSVPNAVREVAELELEDWRDLLKITVDHFVRAGGSLEVDRDLRKWLGFPFPQSFLVDRDESDLRPLQRRWPRATRMGARSKLGRLLSFGLKVSNRSLPSDDVLDTILLELWNALGEVGLLVQRELGRVLPLNALSFSIIREGWLCPVTRSVLDTSFRGITPYLPESPSAGAANCEKIRIPVYSKAFSDTSDDQKRIRLGRAWLETNEDVQELREAGVWSSFHDRVVELAPYFTTAEHSAQQDSPTLSLYEKRFKNGELNLLSCSTTMEMGIDIGGIAIVAMNNVPPHPANYLQRAGRAGRRREARSTSMTLCKANPHDQNVFSNTRWAFDCSLPAPKVSLDSPRIVQRHVNSYLLSTFLASALKGMGAEAHRLYCGDFFLGERPLYERFCSWSVTKGTNTDEAETLALGEIVRGSVFEGRQMSGVTAAAAAELKELSRKWLSEWEQLENDRLAISGQPGHEPVAVKAIEMQARRMFEEYLLKELASRGFLPSHGFPINIASFDNLTISQFKRMKQNADGRDDNRFRRREMASRDIATALREYAPGSDIVLDGLVFRSAGITLNWHIPASETDIKEIQEIRYAIRCRKCGASSSTASREASKTCFSCASAIENADRIEFLEPAGFAVDFYEDPSNDITAQTFIPVEDPWTDADGSWMPLPNPHLGRYRVTTNGHIFHQSRGAFGFGYAVCLECGRAEPMRDRTTMPSLLASPHRKLRRSKDESGFCPGSNNSWKIKKNLSLGFDGWTDMIEIQLRSEVGVWLDDPVAAQTICVALRNAFAGAIGIQSSELGCQIKQSSIESGGKCRSLLIFDRFAAGYSSTADRFIEPMFRSARSTLQCSADCDAACPNCILDFDQRFAIDRLDRQSALGFLTEEWMDSLKLPEEFAYFGEGSELETRPLFESLVAASSTGNVKTVRLFSSGRAEEWDVPISTLSETAYRLAAQYLKVEIHVPINVVDDLGDENRYFLASMADHPNISVLTRSDGDGRAGSGWVIAEVDGAQPTRWAVGEEDALCFGSGWGAAASPLVKRRGGVEELIGTRLTSSMLRPTPLKPADREIEIHNELDGPVLGFGNRLWAKITAEFERMKELLDEEALTSITYSDRYLHSPIAIALLQQVVSGLRPFVNEHNWQVESIAVSTTNKLQKVKYPSVNLNTDWTDPAIRDSVLTNMFDGAAHRVHLRVLDRKDIEHGRKLELSFATGKALIVRFDQGMGYWRVPQTTNRQMVQFPFSDDIGRQARHLKNLSVRVEGQCKPTQIFLTVR